MKKVIVFDPTIGTTNLGDEIILKSANFFLQSLFWNDFIVRLPTRLPLMKFYQKSTKNILFRTIINSDLKIICGTNLLYTNLLRPWPLLNINLFDLQLFKGSILMGVGCGINSKKVNYYTKYIYKKILRSDIYHSVRDNFTKEFLEDLGLKAINTGCPTLWKLDNYFCREIPINKSEDVIFTLTDYAKDIENDTFLIKVLLNNYKNVYFWPQSIEDLSYLNNLNVNFSNIKILPPKLITFENYLRQGKIDYIGTRLHAGIFALQHKVRTIILSVDYRAIQMKSFTGLPIYDRTDIKNTLKNLIYDEISVKNLTNNENVQIWLNQFQNY